MKKTLLLSTVVCLFMAGPSVFAIINEYQFEGTIDNITGGAGNVLNVNAFSGSFIYNSEAFWFSGGGGVANYDIISFEVKLNGPGVNLDYPDSFFTRRRSSVRNVASEDFDFITFFADDWYPQTIYFRIFLEDFDKTVIPGYTEFPSLPESLNLADFELSELHVIDNSGIEFNGTITSLTLVPEPCTLLLLGLGGLALRVRRHK